MPHPGPLEPEEPIEKCPKVIRRYIEPLLEIETFASIRLGTKALAW